MQDKTSQPLIETLPMALGTPYTDDPSTPLNIEIPLQVALPDGQTLYAAVALGGLPFHGQQQIAERIAAAWNAFAGVATANISAPGQCLHQIQEPAVNQQLTTEQEPVTGQSRFAGHEWGTCSVEHVRWMLGTGRAKDGYEVRYLYAAPVLAAQPQVLAAIFAARGALQHLKEGGKPTEALINCALQAIDSVAEPQAAPAAVAVPDERAAFEQWLMKELDTIRWEPGLKDWYFTRRDDGNYVQQAPRERWEAWQAGRAALAATPAAAESDVWPCVNIDVDDAGNVTSAKLYSPGLPAGNHDV